MGKRPSFTNINDSVCMYCSKMVVFDSPGLMDIYYGCKIRTVGDGVYKSIEHYESQDDELTTIEKGCGEFESSGLPAHPNIIKELKRRNYLAKNIPADENATETSWDFFEKMKKYVGEENILINSEQIKT